MKTRLILLFTVLSLGILSCSKYPADTGRLTEDFVVYTKYNTANNFQQYTTFAIVDSIDYISPKDSGRYLNPQISGLLERISSNMVARGYTKVSHDQQPDLGITVSAVKTTTTTVYYPGWYWDDPGYYNPYYWGYPGYGYYYPFYPTYISSYSAGSLIIDLIDFKNPTPDNKYAVEWSVFIRALLTGNHTDSQIQTAIDQAFTQTPAIKKTSK